MKQGPRLQETGISVTLGLRRFVDRVVLHRLRVPAVFG